MLTKIKSLKRYPGNLEGTNGAVTTIIYKSYARGPAHSHAEYSENELNFHFFEKHSTKNSHSPLYHKNNNIINLLIIISLHYTYYTYYNILLLS